MRLTDEHFNGDKTTGTHLMNTPKLTFDQYIEIVKDAGCVHKTTTAENMVLSKIPNKFNDWERSYEIANIELVMELKPQNKNRPWTGKQMAKLKTHYRNYTRFHDDYNCENATEYDKWYSVNRSGRDACKIRFTRTGMVSKNALELMSK